MLGQPGSDFGIFSPLFGGGTPYLALLHLGVNAEKVVRRVQQCARSTENPFPDICRFLDDANWRPHLVAAVALGDLGYEATSFDKLWHAIDCGSWVMPQLGVVAYLRDPGFLEMAKMRLDAHCQIDVSRLAPLDPPLRHSAAGPGGAKNRAAKAAVVFIRLLQLMPVPPTWLASYVESAEFIDLAQHDIDHSAAIAEKWMTSLTRLL
jgi:hypothetical protein